MTGARIFVAIVFILLGASFLASTGLLIREFQDAEWGAMLLAHSHLFVFYPLFGILALAAFYLPSVIFVDLYWRHLPFGKLRFLAGLAVITVVSFGVFRWLDKEPRAVWEIAPQALLADRGEPAGCSSSASAACQRAPILGSARKPSQGGPDPSRPFQVRAQLQGRPHARVARRHEQGALLLRGQCQAARQGVLRSAEEVRDRGVAPAG